MVLIGVLHQEVVDFVTRIVLVVSRVVEDATLVSDFRHEVFWFEVTVHYRLLNPRLPRDVLLSPIWLV